MRRDPIAWLALAAAAVTIALTAAAFWLSYEHLHDVAAAHGLAASTARAWAWPATVDMFIVVGELLVLRSSLAHRVDWIAIGLTTVGSGASIALNVAGTVALSALDYVVSAVPPVAALLAFGALMRQLHAYLGQIAALPQQVQHQANQAVAAGTEADDAEAPTSTPVLPALQPTMTRAAEPAALADPADLPTVKDAVLAAAVLLGEGAAARTIVQQVAQQHGIETTEGSVRATLSRYSTELAELRAQFTQQIGMYL